MKESEISNLDKCQRLGDVLRQLADRTSAGASEMEIRQLKAEAQRLNAETGQEIQAALGGLLSKIEHQVDKRRTAAAGFMRTVSPLLNGESVVVAPACPKLAALCYHRVWCPSAPQAIRFFAGTDAEAELLGLIMFLHEESADLERLRGVAAVLGYSGIDLAEFLPSLVKAQGRSSQTTYHAVAEFLRGRIGRHVPVVYSSEKSRVLEYTEGQSEIAVAALDGLDLVDEHKLEWAQVLEFRKDKASVKSFQGLLHWLDSDLIGKSPTFIHQRLEKRMGKYRRALQAHGIETKRGIFETMVDERTLLSGAASATIGAAAVGQLWAALAGLSVVLAKVGLRIWRDRVKLQELKADNAEVAFVCEVQDELGRKAT